MKVDATSPVAPSAPADDEDYYEVPESEAAASTSGERRAPPTPPIITESGQSRSHARRGAEGGHDDNAHSAEPGRPQGDSGQFFLRHLHIFKEDFSGKAILDWTRKVDMILRITGALDSEILPLLPLRVEPQVFPFLEGLRDRMPPSQYKWPNVKEALLHQYGGVTDPSQLVNKLHAARMSRDMPVRKFAQEIEQLTRLAYPELVSDVGTPEQRATQRDIFNRIAMEQFVSGLPPILSRPIVEKQIATLDSAVSLAAHLEGVNARYFKRSTINAFYNDADNNDSPDSADSNQHRNHGRGRPGSRFQPRAQSTEPRLQQGQGARPRFQPRSQSGAESTRAQGPDTRYVQPTAGQRDPRSVQCFGCGRMGHRIAQCPNHPNPGDVRSVQCYRCGELGHIRAQCSACSICIGPHDTATCPNVLCAGCKQPGHPANICPKNLKGRPTPPPTS